MNLSGLKIATKLWLFIGLVLVLLVGIAGVGLARSAGILAEGRAQTLVAQKNGSGGHPLEWIDRNQRGQKPRHHHQHRACSRRRVQRPHQGDQR